MLRDNLLINEVSSLASIYDLALSDSAGYARFYIPDDTHGLLESSSSLDPSFRPKHSAVREVETQTLDGFRKAMAKHEPAPDVCLIDVEGNEVQVIRGAR